ncbi:MAG: hypothetical protein UT94_C0058G0002 [Candidatus Uhrbacteria bacterium GW2011_GWF2_40_263]|nr:MAG: hypothetical protein UT94_C0058G0002 [Candidatus Uhrbacteria bacterium GW2011_GWF2_40_263]
MVVLRDGHCFSLLRITLDFACPGTLVNIASLVTPAFTGSNTFQTKLYRQRTSHSAGRYRFRSYKAIARALETLSDSSALFCSIMIETPLIGKVMPFPSEPAMRTIGPVSIF